MAYALPNSTTVTARLWRPAGAALSAISLSRRYTPAYGGAGVRGGRSQGAAANSSSTAARSATWCTVGSACTEEGARVEGMGQGQPEGAVPAALQVAATVCRCLSSTTNQRCTPALPRTLLGLARRGACWAGGCLRAPGDPWAAATHPTARAPRRRRRRRRRAPRGSILAACTGPLGIVASSDSLKQLFEQRGSSHSTLRNSTPRLPPPAYLSFRLAKATRHSIVAPAHSSRHEFCWRCQAELGSRSLPLRSPMPTAHAWKRGRRTGTAAAPTLHHWLHLLPSLGWPSHCASSNGQLWAAPSCPLSSCDRRSKAAGPAAAPGPVLTHGACRAFMPAPTAPSTRTGQQGSTHEQAHWEHPFDWKHGALAWP